MTLLVIVMPGTAQHIATPVSHFLSLLGVLGTDEYEIADDNPHTYTTELGYYTGLKPANPQQDNRRVTYKLT